MQLINANPCEIRQFEVHCVSATLEYGLLGKMADSF